MAIKKGDYVTYQDDNNKQQYGMVAETMGDTAKVQHHTMNDDGTLTPADTHHMLPVAKLKAHTPKNKGEGKAVVLILSDDGDPFKIGDTVAFRTWEYDSSSSSETGSSFLGIIRNLVNNQAVIETLDNALSPTGKMVMCGLVDLHEYMIPGINPTNEGKAGRIEIISNSPADDKRGVEYKSLGGLEPQSVNGRTVDGIAAVFGNIDDANDITHRGSFAKTIREQKGRIMFTFNHEINDLPRARIDDLHEITRDELPVQVKSRYPEATGGLFVRRTYLETPRGEEAFQGVTNNAINEMSYGFIPIKKDFGTVEGKSVRNLREVRLIDICDTTMGINPAAMSRKSALSFHDGPAEDKGAAWDGPAEVAKADVSQLKSMCAWVDPDHADTKQGYKLPYRTADGKINWNATKAAMGALMGARGGVSIPEADRRGVYNVLAKAYKKFDEEPPDYKSFELAWSVQDARTLLAAGVDFKAGRMISAANEAKIRDVIDAIESQLETLEDLLGTAEPPDQEVQETEGKALTDTAVLLALLEMTETEAMYLVRRD